MAPNFITLALSALIPLVVGFLWYNPKTLGTAWMKAADMTEEKMKGANMAIIFGITYVLSIMVAMGLFYSVIHQAHIYSLFQGDPGFMEEGSATMGKIADLMNEHGHKFRTFKHGALHGGIAAIFMALPVLGINALFERKGFKYIAINVGYWFVSFLLMGGVICQWG